MHNVDIRKWYISLKNEQTICLEIRNKMYNFAHRQVNVLNYQ